MKIITKAEKFKIRVEKVGRKWAQIKVYYPSGYVGKAKIDKDAVTHIPAGSTGTVLAVRHTIKNAYGAETTLEAVKNEAEMNRVNAEQLYKRFLEKIEEGYIPTGIIKKIEETGCHDYDEVIRQKQIDFLIRELGRQADEGRMGSSEYERLESLLRGSEQGVVLTRLKIRDTWARIRSRFAEDWIPTRLIDELHMLGSHEYDADILAETQRIRELKLKEVEEKKRKEREERICRLALPAARGRAGMPEPGMCFMHRGVPYQTVSSHYNDSDGFSFGAMSEEWYDVKAKDISDTEKGQKMIHDSLEEKRKNAMKVAYMDAMHKLESAIELNGRIYEGETISIDDVPGEMLFDTFTITGYGSRVYDTGDTVWLVVNNGSDGAYWGRNNISTGGAGAYAYICDRIKVTGELNTFMDALAAAKAVPGLLG